MNNQTTHLLELLQNQFHLNDLNGDIAQNIWIMAASIAPYSELHHPMIEEDLDPPTHTVRIVLRTTDEDGTNDYVDGTDIFISIDEDSQAITLMWEDLWIEGPPIFHGGTIPDALKWMHELADPFYTQFKDPFLSSDQRIALNGYDDDYPLPDLPKQPEKEKDAIPLKLTPKDFEDLF